MSTIPTSLTEKQFDEHIRPYISVAKRGYNARYPCTRFSTTFCFAYILGANGIAYQLKMIQRIPEKKKSVVMRFTTIFASGAGMAV